MKTTVIDWNLIPYAEAWQRQTEYFDTLVRAKQNGEEYENVIILCEHSPVYTLGRSGKENNMLLSEAQLANQLSRTMKRLALHFTILIVVEI